MAWMTQFDAYCERVDLSFWAEPVNALTNLGFVLMALWMWRRASGVPLARALCAVLGAIGVGSFLFHTFATAWAGLADVAPIGAFILLYLFAVNRDAVGLRPIWAAVATAGFIPYALVMVPLLDRIPFFRISDFYWTVPLLLVIYAVGLRARTPRWARDMVVGAAILSLSITLRSVDLPLCEEIPVGTHFWWHLLNAVMLGWMIEAYRRFRTGN